MITSPFAAGLAKVVAVGALMAAGAGGIYVISLTNDGNDATPQADLSQATASALAPTPALQPMTIEGSVWVNARRAYARVTAMVEGSVCAEADSGSFPDEYEALYTLRVVASTVKSGCGVEGATVHFAVDGVVANEVVNWHSGTTVSVDITVGPAFARYEGKFNSPDIPYNIRIEPTIDGQSCGQQLNELRGLGPEYYDLVAVDSEQLKSGCGRTGATVHFRLVALDEKGIDGRVIAELPATAAWSPGSIIAIGGP